MRRILVVDDDKAIRLSLGLMLRHMGFEAEAVATPDEALTSLRQRRPALMLMDMNFTGATSGADGLELLQRTKVLCPDLPVILMTAWGSIPLAVEGMKLGASDFLTKPFNGPLLLQRINTAIDLMSSASTDADTDSRPFDRAGIIGESRELTDILHTVARIAPTDASVLITGENGTGKEMIAHAIHANSLRRKGPFVMVNLGGLSQSLFESEMFGHKRGAFTGAVADRRGRFELADKGTIFLDEIGDLDINCQVKLLRVLQQHTFEALGDSTPRSVDIRVVSATNADLGAMLSQHTFREDLYYRINAITIHVPPLRERTADILPLVRHFASQVNMDHRPEFASDALEYLTRLPYPGNVRQLKNIVERAMLMTPGNIITRADIEKLCLGAESTVAKSGATLEAMEREAVERALRKHAGNISEAARELGITRQALYRKIDKYGI